VRCREPQSGDFKALGTVTRDFSGLQPNMSPRELTLAALTGAVEGGGGGGQGDAAGQPPAAAAATAPIMHQQHPQHSQQQMQIAVAWWG